MLRDDDALAPYDVAVDAADLQSDPGAVIVTTRSAVWKPGASSAVDFVDVATGV